MEIKIPTSIINVMKALEKCHYEVYLVGGSVRDQLMELAINDYDLTTSATPDQMQSVFHDVYPIIPTGIKHGTLTIIVDHKAVEITTFRKDKNYENHRTPNQVIFTPSLLEDLKRRDFTINAIAYHPSKGIIDPFNGLADIKKRIVHCVGDPNKRFDEDALRMMRAIRFSHALNFTIESKTKAAIIKQAHLLSFISNERIMQELVKCLKSENKDLLYKLQEVHLLDKILPDVANMVNFDQQSPWHKYDLFKHTQIALNNASTYSINLKLAILLHDIGKLSTQNFDEHGIAHYKKHAYVSCQQAQLILKRLCFDRKTISNVMQLIEYHDYYLQNNERIVVRFLNKINYDYDLARDILLVQLADDLAKNPEKVKAKIEVIQSCLKMIETMKENQSCITLKTLAINGNHLITLGYKNKEIGDTLVEILEKVNDHALDNNLQALLHYAKKVSPN
ncbi:MAG: HD domain-containing protein [Erysipelotrichaceae bacterium]